MKSKEFQQSLAQIAAALRANIEANCAGWDNDPKQIAERVAQVKDEKTGFAYFIQHYFPHYIRHESQSDLHRYLFDVLPEVLQSPQSCLEAIAAPRGEAKSTIVSQLFALYCIVTHRKHYIVVIMDSIDQAYPMLEAIKAELEVNPRIKIDFPDVAGAGGTWQAGSIVTRNGIKMQVAGAGKKLRGLRHGAYRPDLVVLDDIENDEQVLSAEQRDKRHNWLKNTVMPLGAAGEKLDIIYIGTILHYDSVLSRTLKNPAWRSARFKAIVRWPDNMDLWEQWEEIYNNDSPQAAERFYHENRQAMDKGCVVSWAARPILELMYYRLRDGHASFDSEYQNDPVSGDDAPFNGVIQYWAEEPRDLILFGAVDPSLGKHGKSRDPSAIVIGGYERKTGIVYVLEAAIKKRLPDRIISDIIEYQRQYRCFMWFVETIQFQEFLYTELVKRSAQQGVPVPARAVTPHADKMLRIESLQPHIKNGLIKLHQTQTTLISQLEHFPKADHDDGPDALHMLWAGAISHARVGETRSLVQPEPSIY